MPRVVAFFGFYQIIAQLVDFLFLISYAWKNRQDMTTLEPKRADVLGSTSWTQPRYTEPNENVTFTTEDAISRTLQGSYHHHKKG